MNFIRIVCITAISLLGAGCSTVNLHDFSDKTLGLQTTIVSEHQEVLTQYNEIIVLTQLGEKEKWFEQTVLPASNKAEEEAIKNLAAAYNPQKWVEEKKDFLSVATDVNELLNTLVAYSTAIANLSAKGETGKKAVEEAAGTLTNIAKIVDPAAAGIPSEIVAILKEIGDIYTRAQAQEKLSDAMNLIASQQGAQKIAVVINAYVDKGLIPLASGLKSSRIVLENYKAGPESIAFYNLQSTWHAQQRTFALLNLDDAATATEVFQRRSEAQIYAALIKCYSADNSGCPNASAISDLASRQLLLRAVQEDVRRYKDIKMKTLSWAGIRKARGEAIKAAIEAWAIEHDRLASYLNECAGFRALKGECGAYSAANLEAAIERVTGVLSELEAADSDS